MVPKCLVGTGGWAYFRAPNKPSLEAYSEIFNFVEVNYTFYEYPDYHQVEDWKRRVPSGFTFAVRCHQDLTHRIGLRPVDEAYTVFEKGYEYCRILDAPFMILETPQSYILNTPTLEEAKEFLSSVKTKDVRLVWEIRAKLNEQVVKLMQDLNMVHCVDLSKEEPAYASDVIYSRLFGKGQMNLYQFTDEELSDIENKVLEGIATGVKVVALSYHGARMNSDAARFANYIKTGKFISATAFTGIDSVKAVLSEDAQFPLSKQNLINKQGWKVVDLSIENRVHLSDLLTKIPDKTYNSVREVASVVEAVL